MSRLVNVADIVAREDLCARARLRMAIVREYADLFKKGTQFPPVDLFAIGKELVLADGFHRYEAAKLAQVVAIPGELHRGNLQDAILFAAQANLQHGCQRSRQDKIRCIEMVLGNPLTKDWSNQKIIDELRVGKELVREVRGKPAVNKVIETRRNGKPFKIRWGGNQWDKQPKSQKAPAGQNPWQTAMGIIDLILASKEREDVWNALGKLSRKAGMTPEDGRAFICGLLAADQSSIVSAMRFAAR